MKSKYIVVASLGMFLLSIISLMLGIDTVGEYLMYASIISIVLIFPFIGIIELIVRRHEFEEKRKVKLAKINQEQERQRTTWQQKEVERQKKYTIVEVKYLGPGAATYKHGGLSGALWGGLFGGPVGFVVGAMLGSPNPKEGDSLQQFAVTYGDGHVEIKELHPNNWEYKKLIDLVNWD